MSLHKIELFHRFSGPSNADIDGKLLPNKQTRVISDKECIDTLQKCVNDWLEIHDRCFVDDIKYVAAGEPPDHVNYSVMIHYSE